MHLQGMPNNKKENPHVAEKKSKKRKWFSQVNWKARNVVMFDLPSGTWCCQSPPPTTLLPPPLAHMSQHVKSSKEPARVVGQWQTWRMRNATRHFCKLDENLWLFSAPSKDTSTHTLAYTHVTRDAFVWKLTCFVGPATPLSCPQTVKLLQFAQPAQLIRHSRHNEKQKRTLQDIKLMGYYTYTHTHAHTEGMTQTRDKFAGQASLSFFLLVRPFGLCCKLFSCCAAHATNKTNSSFKFPKIYKFMWLEGVRRRGGLTLNKLLAICCRVEAGENILYSHVILLSVLQCVRSPVHARSLS